MSAVEVVTIIRDGLKKHFRIPKADYVQSGLRREAEFARTQAKRATSDLTRRYYELYARNLEEAARCR